MRLRLDAAMLARNPAACVDALEAFRAHPLWQQDFLVERLQCYQLARHPLADAAADDLEQFLTDEGAGLGEDLLPPR
jgi:spermidine synthase